MEHKEEINIGTEPQNGSANGDWFEESNKAFNTTKGKEVDGKDSSREEGRKKNFQISEELRQGMNVYVKIHYFICIVHMRYER